MREKIVVTGKAPKTRNPVASSLRAFRSTTEKKAKGRGSYRRKKKASSEAYSGIIADNR
jgi:stalled ribosome alternative rescue factor ArfA